MKNTKLGRIFVTFFIIATIISMILLYFLPAIQSAQQ